MNKNLVKIIFGISAVLLISLFARPQIAQAASYSVGSLVKYEKEATVYYIASDGYAYPFPDEATYKSWYDDFSDVKSLSSKNFSSVKKKSIPITVYPTSRFVKFDDSDKVYAVRPGAELRWIKSESLAKKIGGNNWNKRIITLPEKSVLQYTIGQPIAKLTDIDEKHEVRNALAIDKELKSRGVVKVKETKTTKKQTSYGAQLKYIKENVKDSLDPKFDPEETYYELVAKYEEEEINFSVAAYDTDAKIAINDLPIPTGSTITFKLSKPGTKQSYYIKSSLPNGTEKTYEIKIKRENPDDEDELASLSENLRDSFRPKFNRVITFYRIEANEKEESVTIKAKTKSAKATMTINGKQFKTSGSYTKKLAPSGETTLRVIVTAQSGREKTYTIIVEK